MMTKLTHKLPEVIDAAVPLDPVFGDWQTFLSTHTDLRAVEQGVGLYSTHDYHFVVFPSGFTVQAFGAKGPALIARIQKDGVADTEGTLRANRAALADVWDDPEMSSTQRARNICDWLLAIRDYHHLNFKKSTTRKPAQGRQRYETAIPVLVDLPSLRGVTVRPGALYCEAVPFEPQETAVTYCGMKAGDLRRSYRLYILGDRWKPHRTDRWIARYDLPTDVRKPLESCYTPTDEWYVGYHLDTSKWPTSTAQQKLYSPFGPAFGLCLHQEMNAGPYAGDKVDSNDKTSSIRIRMSVTYLTHAKTFEGMEYR